VARLEREVAQLHTALGDRAGEEEEEVEVAEEAETEWT
jgi:hypothetical protein